MMHLVGYDAFRTVDLQLDWEITFYTIASRPVPIRIEDFIPKL